jgi:predicted nucleotidyltransferase
MKNPDANKVERPQLPTISNSAREKFCAATRENNGAGVGPSSSQEITALLTRQRIHLKTAYHVSDIGIFGSCVRGTMKKRSDIDVLVSFEQGFKDLFNYLRLKRYLEEVFGRKVDLVIKEAVKPRLRDKILSEVLYVR